MQSERRPKLTIRFEYDRPSVDLNSWLRSPTPLQESEIRSLILSLADSRKYIDLFGLLERWDSLDQRPISASTWSVLLTSISTASDPRLFPKVLDYYKAAGYKQSLSIYASMIRWYLKHKEFKQDPPKLIADSLHSDYLTGLLDPKATVMRMAESTESLQSFTCYEILENMSKILSFIDLKDVYMVIKSKCEAEQPDMAYCLMKAVRTKEDFYWVMDNIPSNFKEARLYMQVFHSLWAETEEFSPLPVIESALENKVYLSRQLLRLVLGKLPNPASLLPILRLKYPSEAVRISFMTAIQEYKLYQIHRTSWSEGCERIIFLAYKQSVDATIAAAELSIELMREFGSFDFQLSSILCDRLLFNGKVVLATQLLMTLIKQTRLIGVTGSLNTLLKRIHEHGYRSFGIDLIEQLSALNLPQFAPSIEYGKKLFHGKAFVYQDTFETAEELIAAVKTTLRNGQLHRALQLIDDNDEIYFHSPGDVEDLMLSKLEIFSKMGPRESFLSYLEDYKVFIGSPGVDEIIDVYNGKSFTFTTIDNPIRSLKLANILFQNYCLQRPLSSSISLMNRLFTKLKPDLTTVKIYVDALCKGHDHSFHTEPPSKILLRIGALGLQPDVDTYDLLIDYALTIGEYEEMMQILAKLLASKGLPNTPILAKLFRWIDQNGDLNSALELHSMMQRLGIPPISHAFNVIVGKHLAANDLSQARHWIIEATNSDYKTAKCSSDLVSEYFDRFYSTNSLEECQRELDFLIQYGYTVHNDFYFKLLDIALRGGDLPRAESYFNRLQNQKAMIDASVFLRMAELYLEHGRIDSIGAVFGAMKCRKIRLHEFKSATEYIEMMLPSISDRHPSFFERLVLPEVGMAAYCNVVVLNYAIRYEHRLSPEWCSRVLTNLVIHGHYEQANSFLLHMVTKGYALSGTIVNDITRFWRTRNKPCKQKIFR